MKCCTPDYHGKGSKQAKIIISMIEEDSYKNLNQVTSETNH